MNEPTIQQLFDLTGRVALITGGSGYLGSAMARALAEAGADVVCGSRRQETARQVAAGLPRSPGQNHGDVELDYFDQDLLEAGFRQVVQTHGRLDILVNNGHSGDTRDWTNVESADFDRVLHHATGYFLLARLFRDHVVARQAGGAVVLVGSMYGVVGSYPDAYQGVCPASPVHYHALKGSLIQMTRHLAVYWAPDKVRVNCLSPGPFPSERAPAELVERLREKSPLGRMGVPSELKGPLLLLVSDAGSYLTGQNLLIDGGWTAW